MAEKETKPKTAAKPAAAKKTTSSAAKKPEEKTVATAKPATATKPAAKEANKATAAKQSSAKQAAPASKTAASATKPAAKTTEKPAAKQATATTKPAAAAKSVTAAKPTVTDKPSAAKPTATAKPAVKAETKTTTAKPTETKAAAPATKPAAKTAAATTADSGIKSKIAAMFGADKPKKQTKKKSSKSAKNSQSSNGRSSIMAKVDSILKAHNFKMIMIITLVVILVLSLTLGLVLGLKGCSPEDPLDNPLDNPFSDIGDLLVTSIASSHNNKTQVGYSGEIVGVVERNKPVEEIQNQGLSSKGYPKYGSTMNLTTAEKSLLIQESRLLTANGTWVDVSKRTSGTYDLMDKDGYLYLKTKDADGNYLKPSESVPERLYKHTASVGLYGGNVSDDEPAVIKNLTFRPRSYGSYYEVTGLYAPAGEVIKIEMTAADMNATGGITIHIGQALYNGQANNIWEQRGVNRMPVILNTMVVTKETATYNEETGLWTAYVGSFLGGPIYVRSASTTYSVTISGGVNYAHFILGVTTEDEYALYSKSTAPYFDLEVWDRGVLHSGPKRAAARFSTTTFIKQPYFGKKYLL